MSVRVLMGVVLYFGGGMGWIVHRARVQRDAVAAIVRGGGIVHYEWDVKYLPSPGGNVYQVTPGGKPRWPKWLVDLLGPDYFGDVKVVVLGTKDADSVMASVGQLSRLGVLYGPYRGLTLTDTGLVHLRGLTQLEVLILYNRERITGAGLANLKDLKRLRRLHLTGAGDFGDADLIHLKDLTALESLAVRNPRITDAGLFHLGGLVEMRSLDLMDTQATAAGLHHLRFMTQLNSLHLKGTRVDGLSPIRSLTHLKLLNIAGTPINDADLANLEGLTELGFLDLSGTRVTDAGLEHLRGLKKLRMLRVRFTQVSDPTFAALRQVLPSLAKPGGPGPAVPEPPRPKAD
jgi:internalin A